jgi:hypothetical protein
MFDHVIFDEVPRDFRVREFADVARSSKAKFSVVGTFKPDNPIVGQIWSEARVHKTGWVSLPSLEEEWKVETILSLANPKYTVDY